MVSPSQTSMARMAAAQTMTPSAVSMGRNVTPEMKRGYLQRQVLLARDGPGWSVVDATGADWRCAAVAGTPAQM
jgi:hypothetical protein